MFQNTLQQLLCRPACQPGRLSICLSLRMCIPVYLADFSVHVCIPVICYQHKANDDIYSEKVINFGCSSIINTTQDAVSDTLDVIMA